MNKKIIEFLKKQPSVSFSCINSMNDPFAFSCFIAFNTKENLLYYQSGYHSLPLMQRGKMPGAVIPDELPVKRIPFSVPGSREKLSWEREEEVTQSIS
jgi:hypothetical protein